MQGDLFLGQRNLLWIHSSFNFWQRENWAGGARMQDCLEGRGLCGRLRPDLEELWRAI